MELLENKLFSKIFMWMFIGLAITFGVGCYVSTNPNMVFNLFGGYTWILLVIVELILAVALSAFITKLSPMVAKVLFCLYSFITGLTFSTIFIEYELPSIIYVFGLTALVFLIFALIGYFTNIDLTKFGIYLLMALLAIVIASIINMFLDSEVLDLSIIAIGIIVFVGYIAYDVNLIKNNFLNVQNENIAIYGAFQLYLDFINLFIKLIRLFGKERN